MARALGIPQVDVREVGPETLSKSYRERRYGYETFSGLPFCWSDVDGFGNPVGTAARVNGLNTGQNNWSWFIIGTQTIVVPATTTDGFYDFGLDQTVAEGTELVPGGNPDKATTGGNAPYHYTIGTDACFFRLVFSAEDVSGADVTVGLRRVEAFNATRDDYLDLAALRVLGDSTSAAGDISTETILNNGTTTSTSSTDTLADGTAVEFLVKASATGVVTFAVNGVAPSTTQAFTFDDGDIVVPFIHFLNTTDVGGEFKLRRAEWGLLADLSNSTLTVP